MPFSSPIFLFGFLPLALLAQVLLPRRARNGALLAFSLLFYAWGEPRAVLAMLGSIGANYGLGRAVGGAGRTPRGRLLVGLAVAVDLGLLGYFKYANFLRDEVARLGLELGFAEIALPIGISFYTFQAISYVVDVYRGDAPVQRSLVDFALYIALFPQLIAGPIVRYRDIADQLADRRPDVARFASGVRRFVVGLGKKVLVADTVSVAADGVFGVPTGELTTGLAWLGVVAYALQIYFDFSGYSDMAIGLGRMLGLELRENFRQPYVSQSITEFWRRWHISLSTWFRDYLYVPLGGNRRGRLLLGRNLAVVFLLCGLWHGASWNFVLWGAYHGAFLVLERAGLGALLERAPRPLRHAYLLLVVLVGWVPFRAEGLDATSAFLAALVGAGGGAGTVYHIGLFLLPHVALALAAGAIGSLPVASWLRARLGDGVAPRLVAHAFFVAVFVLCAGALAAGTHSPFIYFRF